MTRAIPLLNCQRVRVHWVLYPVRSISCVNSCSIPSAKTIGRQDRRAERSRCERVCWVHWCTFCQGLGLPSDHTHAQSHSNPHMHAHGPSLFDEPLASAISAKMAYDCSAGGAHVTILMLPNGAAQQLIHARLGMSWGRECMRRCLG